jgi:hypothetical protein
VEEEFPGGRVGDDRSLVADDEIVEACLLEVGPYRAEHPPRDDNDVRAGGSRARERVSRAGPQHAVLGDQGPVEVQRERGDPRREAVRKLDGYGALPPVESTT